MHKSPKNCHDKSASNYLRLLIIEDNDYRIECIKNWLPDHVTPIIATSAGRALGILHLDQGDVFFGIMLDHDLNEQPTTETDRFYSGTDVVNAIIQNISIETPILIHSMNSDRAVVMENRLSALGFEVTRIPMVYLDESNLVQWLTESIATYQWIHDC